MEEIMSTPDLAGGRPGMGPDCRDRRPAWRRQDHGQSLLPAQSRHDARRAQAVWFDAPCRNVTLRAHEGQDIGAALDAAIAKLPEGIAMQAATLLRNRSASSRRSRMG